jgi:hypothetical protein
VGVRENRQLDALRPMRHDRTFCTQKGNAIHHCLFHHPGHSDQRSNAYCAMPHMWHSVSSLNANSGSIIGLASITPFETFLEYCDPPAARSLYLVLGVLLPFQILLNFKFQIPSPPTRASFFSHPLRFSGGSNHLAALKRTFGVGLRPPSALLQSSRQQLIYPTNVAAENGEVPSMKSPRDRQAGIVHRMIYLAKTAHGWCIRSAATFANRSSATTPKYFFLTSPNRPPSVSA